MFRCKKTFIFTTLQNKTYPTILFQPISLLSLQNLSSCVSRPVEGSGLSFSHRHACRSECWWLWPHLRHFPISWGFFCLLHCCGTCNGQSVTLTISRIKRRYENKYIPASRCICISSPCCCCCHCHCHCCCCCHFVAFKVILGVPRVVVLVVGCVEVNL